MKEFISLGESHPDLALEWAADLNGDLTPDDVTAGSNKKVWWRCKKNSKHVFQAKIMNRVNQHSGCTVCSGRTVIKGVNDLETTDPWVLQLWDDTDYRPDMFTNHSTRKIHWKCVHDNRHVWVASIDSICKHSEINGVCPVCNNTLILPHVNSLAALRPEVAALWDTSNDISADEVGNGSGVKYRFHCYHHHEHVFMSSVRDMTVHKCPICNPRRRTVYGINDLLTRDQELAAEWDYTSNNGLTPDKIAYRSQTQVWWVCPIDGSRWKASPSQRRNSGYVCPQCSRNHVESGVNDLLSLRPDVIDDWDYDRNAVDPSKVSDTNSVLVIHWRCHDHHSHHWDSTILSRTRVHGVACPICRNRLLVRGENDLLTIHDTVHEEWGDKNTIDPSDIMVTYAEPVWWKDTYGHEWKNTIKNHYHDRISGTDCPYCSYKKLMVGFNDLLSQYPDLARSWSMRNGMDARHIMPLMTREYWWTCKQGHDYKASINDLMRGRDCPYCSDRKLMQGFNDFASKAPDWVMEQWDHQRNDPLGLYPDHVLWSADVHAWWKCEHGHQWSTSVYHRSGSTSRISGCPYCSASKGYSHAEKKLLDAVAAMVDDKVIANDKQVLGGKKIDVYVPARGVGIEYNGLYWHSELYLDNAYHYDKWRQANNAGIRLIQVWEDEWSTKPDVVLDCIRSAMGIRMMYKDDARKLYVHNVSNAEAKPFFNDNHIQGWVSGNRILGLYQGESLIACCAFRKYQNMESTIEITRYATLLGHTVRGGMSRLLKHAMADAHADHVITFSDHCVSNGDSYRKLGFINDGEIRPDYAYINNNSREHKFNYRLQDFKNNPDFEYHDGMTEHELATLNGLYRVYDAGKTKWRYDH